MFALLLCVLNIHVLLVIDAHALISLALDWAWGGVTLKVPQSQFYSWKECPGVWSIRILGAANIVQALLPIKGKDGRLSGQYFMVPWQLYLKSLFVTHPSSAANLGNHKEHGITNQGCRGGSRASN